MERWLASKERAAGRKAMYQFVVSHHANVLPTGFGSWFAVNAEDSISAAAWKQAMVVLAALFPIVMILNLTVGNFLTEKNVAFPVDIFIGNTLGTIALTWAVMPVVTRLMDWWLSPRGHLAQHLVRRDPACRVVRGRDCAFRVRQIVVLAIDGSGGCPLGDQGAFSIALSRDRRFGRGGPGGQAGGPYSHTSAAGIGNGATLIQTLSHSQCLHRGLGRRHQ